MSNSGPLSLNSGVLARPVGVFCRGQRCELGRLRVARCPDACGAFSRSGQMHASRQRRRWESAGSFVAQLIPPSRHGASAPGGWSALLSGPKLNNSLREPWYVRTKDCIFIVDHCRFQTSLSIGLSNCVVAKYVLTYIHRVPR